MKRLDEFANEVCAQEKGGSDAFGNELVGRLLTLEEICLVGGGGDSYCMAGGTSHGQTGSGSYGQNGGNYAQTGPGSYNMNCM